MGISSLVVRLRAARSGDVLSRRTVPRLSQVDRRAGLDHDLQAAPSSSAASCARLAEGRSSAAA